MRTLDEAAQMNGITKTDFGLNLHFSPIPNWYMKCGLPCPICDNEIIWDWEWHKEKPVITGEYTPMMCKPFINGATLLKYGHRWITFECNNCHTQMSAENFD